MVQQSCIVNLERLDHTFQSEPHGAREAQGAMAKKKHSPKDRCSDKDNLYKTWLYKDRSDDKEGALVRQQMFTYGCACFHRQLEEGRADDGSPGPRPEPASTRIHDYAQHCIDKAMHTKRMQVCVTLSHHD